MHLTMRRHFSCLMLATVLCCAFAAQLGAADLFGRIAIDGSSTVYPITNLIAREFRKVQPRVWTRVDLSGSGRGIGRLINKQLQIANASRPIKESELNIAREHELHIFELPIGLDGIAVVVNPSNSWVDYLTTDELKKIWQPNSEVRLWSDVRTTWPDVAIEPCAPTAESGTFDFFTTAICGASGAIRQGYYAHEDEHVLAPYVKSHPGAISFFGFGWYKKYEENLKLVPIRDGEHEPVAPSEQSIAEGAYRPLARPLFIYVSAEAAADPAVDAFVRFYIENASVFVAKAGYVSLPIAAYAKVLERYESGLTGTSLHGKSEVGLTIKDLLETPSMQPRR